LAVVHRSQLLLGDHTFNSTASNEQIVVSFLLKFPLQL
jgi:hypothetical protein